MDRRANKQSNLRNVPRLQPSRRSRFIKQLLCQGQQKSPNRNASSNIGMRQRGDRRVSRRPTCLRCHGEPSPLKSLQTCAHLPPRAHPRGTSASSTISGTGPKNPCYALAPNAPVAQLDRASDYESEGRRFESSRVRKRRKANERWLFCFGVEAVVRYREPERAIRSTTDGRRCAHCQAVRGAAPASARASEPSVSKHRCGPS